MLPTPNEFRERFTGIAESPPPCHLRAPKDDRDVLIEPPPDRVPELIARNLELRRQLDYDLQGRPLIDISSSARRELLDAARRWTAQYRNIAALPADAAGPIFLAGHQPQMFHPGVWLKNFALAALAAEHDAAAVTLIVDGDAIVDSSLAVPAGSIENPRIVRVPFDRPEPHVPYEERRIEDRELFASFGRRVMEELRTFVPHPLIERYWPLVEERARHTDNLGLCLAQARHQLEESFVVPPSGGSEAGGTLELAQSRVCSGEAFQWFVAHVLARLPWFLPFYNDAISDYRRVHRLRSRSHPAPALAKHGEWLEAPFWTWTLESPRRRRLFARAAADEIVLSDGERWEARLPLSAEADAGAAVERLLDLAGDGVRIRPRALMTTLWARLALGDLFIHGIGGAKYDWVTDRLIERFFGLRPPGFLVLSATILLPIERHHISSQDIRTLDQELRETAYHPERFMTGSEEDPRPMVTDLQRPEVADLVSTKRRWIETPQTKANARQRCRAIREINAALQPWLDPERRRLVERRNEAVQERQAQEILDSRDYAFCLFPEPTLREFFARLLPTITGGAGC
ncbi:MAG: hypothetical protein ABFC96_08280 [Thermoguttaceae bacterium]